MMYSVYLVIDLKVEYEVFAIYMENLGRLSHWDVEYILIYHQWLLHVIVYLYNDKPISPLIYNLIISIV